MVSILTAYTFFSVGKALRGHAAKDRPKIVCRACGPGQFQKFRPKLSGFPVRWWYLEMYIRM